ncbi:hypothetical protein EAL2_c20100 [Peptoclostridium acidaminophilum DSM 3953]|uniref:O-antigen polymerase n=1 Tax=Peptoclostridium acidaminophilum DSM 3953 TaxID=1286171 RepID=W8U8V9_PEPAC|nr:hypothetical protein [Peptoclostridium acidaminophilum]AHM57291.1 hypothetical protein EAL2_c20100 [Peptoclostridium acidaminophilum DSM 3953]
MVIIIIGDRYFDIRLGAKLYTIIAFVNSLYLFMQYIAYNFAGIVLPWYIKWLPIKQGTRLIEDYNNIFSQYGYRPSGFFFEPAHFTHYVIPALLLVLFYKESIVQNDNRKNIVLSIIFTIALLLSGSGSAVVMTFIVWSMWAFNKFKISLKHIFRVIIIVFLIVGVIQIPIVESSINRVMSDSNLSTKNVRVMRGFAVYRGIELPNKIFGVGYGNYATYIGAKNIQTEYDLGESTYVNTMAYVLVGTGIFGFLLYLLIYYDLFKKTKGFYRYRTVILFISGFFSGNPLSISLITAVSFIIAGYNLTERNGLNEEIEKSTISRVANFK